jgi:hypothetical protein
MASTDQFSNLPAPQRCVRIVAAALAALAALTAAPAQATDVGVSIGINQPGVYGRIDIGRFPQPQVIVQQPVVVYRQAQLPPPVYLHVPPGHRKQWRAHCARYDACGRPVYFVQERWYQDHVARPAPRRGERWDDRRDGRDDGHPGRGHGNGHGKGHGRGHD